MSKVVNELDTYDSNGITDEKLDVTSHWNDDDKVVIIISGKSVIVLADDLVRAIRNSSNLNR